MARAVLSCGVWEGKGGAVDWLVSMPVREAEDWKEAATTLRG